MGFLGGIGHALIEVNEAAAAGGGTSFGQTMVIAKLQRTVLKQSHAIMNQDAGIKWRDHLIFGLRQDVADLRRALAKANGDLKGQAAVIAASNAQIAARVTEIDELSRTLKIVNRFYEIESERVAELESILADGAIEDFKVPNFFPEWPPRRTNKCPDNFSQIPEAFVDFP